MESSGGQDRSARTGVRVEVAGSGRTNVASGVPVLDHLLGLLAVRARLDLTLEVAPGGAEAELAGAGRGIGEALYGALRAGGARGEGSGIAPSGEALAFVALEASDGSLVVSNVDFSRERVGGLGGDVVSRFLAELADGAGLTLHVRLVEGEDRQHVLEAIFKALGAALGQACGPTDRRE